jgi:hypothetical protein
MAGGNSGSIGGLVSSIGGVGSAGGSLIDTGVAETRFEPPGSLMLSMLM